MKKDQKYEVVLKIKMLTLFSILIFNYSDVSVKILKIKNNIDEFY